MKRVKKFFSVLLMLLFVAFAFSLSSVKALSAEVEFEKVTSGPVEDGKYLIAYEDGNKAYVFDSTLSTLDAVNNYVEADIVDDKISISEDYAFTIEGNNIISQSGKYIYQSGDSNKLLTSDSEKSNASISYDSDGTVVVKATGGSYLRFNKASNQMRFRYFKSLTYTSQQAIYLYKLAALVEDGFSEIEYELNEGTIDNNAPTLYEEGKVTTLLSPSKEGFEFLGWYLNSNFSGESISEISASQTGDVKLYAKWKEEAWHMFSSLKTSASLNIKYDTKGEVLKGEPEFTKVSSGNVEDGKYLIVYEDGNNAYVFNSTLDKLDAVNNYIQAEIVNDTISISEEYAFTVDGTNVISENGLYIYRNTTSNGLNTSDSADGSNTITINSDGSANILSGSTALKFNASKDQMRFRYYKIGQKSVYLYKMTSESVSYENVSSQIRFGTCIEKELYDSLGEKVTFGIALIKTEKLGSNELNEKTEGVLLTNITPAQVTSPFGTVESEEGGYYQFAVVVAGLDQDEYDMSLSARAYVIIDGQYYFMEVSEYSIKTLSEYYLASYKNDEDIKSHFGVLKYIIGLE